MNRIALLSLVLLAACGGAEFSGLGPPAPAPSTEASSGGTVLEHDAGVDAEPAPGDERAIEREPDAGVDAEPAPGDAGERLEASPPVEESSPPEPDAAAPVCTTPSACPVCGSAIQVACCTLDGRCGCAFGLGSACR